MLYSAGGLAWSIVKGPLEAIVGVLYGILGGVIIWYLPNRASVSKQAGRLFDKLSMVSRNPNVGRAYKNRVLNTQNYMYL